MADTDLTIVFEDDGSTWDKVTDYKIEESFLVPCDAWSCTVYATNALDLRRKFQPLRPVKVYIGDRLQVIGRIDKTSGAGGGSTALQVSGCDYMANLVRGHVDPSVRVSNSMSLADAILEGLRVFGITTVETNVNEARTKKMGPATFEDRPGTKPLELAKYRASLNPDTQAMVDIIPSRKVSTSTVVGDFTPQEGEGAFAWAERMAARSGLTLQPGSSRTSVALVAPDFSSAPKYTLTSPGNVERGVATRDYSNLPTALVTSSRRATASVEAKGQWRETRIVGDESPSALWRTEEGKRVLTGIVGARLPKNERAAPPLHYQPYYHKDDDARTLEQLDSSARRMLADHMRDTLQYTATMPSHKDPASGLGYAANVMAHVKDEIEDVNEPLWCVSRSLTSGSGGQQAELTLIRPASFVL
jgi:prophage tail gpP-like protein